jgi:EmrB/QacA subfamily drug resistance transporter
MTQPSPRDGDAIPLPVFAVTVTGAFVVALDLSIVNVAFPSIEASFADASTATLSWVLSAYSVVFGALLLGAGRIADRSGRRLTFLVGLGVFTLGSLLCGAATSPALLIGGRVVQAVGAALLMPSSLALLLSATPERLRTTAVATWGGISALAVACGPSIGAVLVDAGGWRWAFLVNLPVLAVAAIATTRVVPESRTGGPPPDGVGIAMVSVSVAALALAITQGPDWGWTSAGVAGAAVAALALGSLAVRRARSHPAPAVDLGILSNRTIALANAGTVLYAIGFFAMLLGNVLFLTSVWGWSTLAAGLAVTPGPIVVALLSRGTGRLASRIGFRPLLVAGPLVFAAAQLWSAAMVPLDPDYLRWWLPQTLVTGLGVALTFPVLSAAAVSGLAPASFAAGGAINQTARQVGAVLGVAVLVAVLGTPASLADAHDRYRIAWAICAAAAVGSALVALRHDRVPVAAPELVAVPVPAAPVAAAGEVPA